MTTCSGKAGRQGLFGGSSGTLAAQPDPADAVSLSPQVACRDGVFTLTGTASGVAGVRQELGTATVNADGTFADQIGANQQTFFEATLTDSTGRQATSADPGFDLTGGPGPRSGAGRQDSFDTTGQQASSTVFRPNGQSATSVDGPGATVDLQPFGNTYDRGQGDSTFVFQPGDESSVVHGFKVGGADHSTLRLSGADFGNSTADVLRDTGDVQGSAFIAGPKTGNTVRLAGVSTAALKADRHNSVFG